MLNSKRIKELRERLGLTQEQAASRAKFKSRQQWNRLERGYSKITLSTLFLVAKALETDPRKLLKI